MWYHYSMRNLVLHIYKYNKILKRKFNRHWLCFEKLSPDVISVRQLPHLFTNFKIQNCTTGEPQEENVCDHLALLQHPDDIVFSFKFVVLFDERHLGLPKKPVLQNLSHVLRWRCTRSTLEVSKTKQITFPFFKGGNGTFRFPFRLLSRESRRLFYRPIKHLNEIELAPLGKPYDQSGRFPLPAVSGIDQVRIFFAPLRTHHFPHQFASFFK